MNQIAAIDKQGAKALELAKGVFRIEARAVAGLADRLDAAFPRAVELILACHGRVIVSGVGKSGHIARKIAATLASTGTPAYFVHAAEAAHGDLGMITREDVVIALSNSGESAELLTIVPLLKRQGGRLIAISGNPASSLAREADAHLDASVAEEACPLNLAPTASTTAALAMGDALAVALLDARGFGAEDFARSHPGGTLGRRLLTHVRDIMRRVEEVPCIGENATVAEAVLAISRGGMGMTAVVTPKLAVVGIFTDGDLRRAMEKLNDLKGTPVSQVMTRHPRCIGPDRLAAESAQIMEEHRISQVLVVDNGVLVGALNTHDLFRAKVI
ncbi:MAG: KpsF/GutQ family sugar-phosphate isomerase [Rhodocyclaceae bacterium]|jgi:arabinose-5-phosphate isomerase|nr:Arabinose 5-phosphate isomerase KdsD [Rhodocyclaceae bacterium]MBZ0142475.1 KpsF/GutQ family sugar-phosphate isomerase [Rhodocyclaceae bacterium]MCL4681615.1 KpsF/GutQ family sugar-phosphate isomerase [Rhodocyclaceae bacterium]